MNKPWTRLLAASGLALSGVAVQAGGIQWSIGINLPPTTTVISGSDYDQGYGYDAPGAYHSPPAYRAAPSYYAPPPVVYRPAPIYYAPPPVAYWRAPIYYAPPVVFHRHGTGHGRPPYYGQRHWAPPSAHGGGHGFRAEQRWDRRQETWRDHAGPGPVRVERGDRGGRPVPRDDRRQRPGPG